MKEFSVNCAGCTAPLPADARFCAACGHSVEAVVAPSAVARAARGVRRHVGLLIAVAAVVVVAAGTASALSHDRDQVRTLRTTEAELATSRTEAAKLKEKMTSTEARVSTLKTEVAGVRGSLTSAKKERESLRRCLRAIVDMGIAYEAGNNAEAERLLRASRKDCSVAMDLI